MIGANEKRKVGCTPLHGEEEEVINVLSRKVSRLFCKKSLEGMVPRLGVINREGGWWGATIAMQAACVLHHPTWSREVALRGKRRKSTNKR